MENMDDVQGDLVERDFVVAWTMDRHLNSEEHGVGGDGVTETTVRAITKAGAASQIERRHPRANILAVREG